MLIRYVPMPVSILMFAGVAVAQSESESDVMQILRAADAATKAVRSVSYQGEFHAEGELSTLFASSTGRVTMRKRRRALLGIQLGYKASPTRVEGFAVGRGAGEKTQFDICVSGHDVWLIDHDRRSCLAGTLPQAPVPYRPARNLVMREYEVGRPFGDEIKARVLRHEGIVEVGDVPCDVIYVLYRNQSESRWCFGREDHLPRRVERMGDNGKTVLTLTDVSIEPLIADDTFAPACPEGYESRRRELVRADPGVLGDYVGVYRINEEEVREVIVEGQRMFTRRSANPRIEVFGAGRDTFFYADSFTALTFVRDAGGNVTHQVLDRLYGDLETAVREGEKPAAPAGEER